MNVAYKHLDARLRIAELSIGQWITAVCGAMVALAWAQFSPFGPGVALFGAIYIGALPVVAAVAATYTEFDLVLFVRSAIAWSRLDGRLVAGPGQEARGYVVHDDVTNVARGAATDTDPLELRRLLWDAD